MPGFTGAPPWDNDRVRYPLEPLFQAMHATPNDACTQLGITGKTKQTYLRYGVSPQVAFRLASELRLKPSAIWRNWGGLVRSCASSDCDREFVAWVSWGRFCSKSCQEREAYHASKEAARLRHPTAKAAA